MPPHGRAVRPADDRGVALRHPGRYARGGLPEIVSLPWAYCVIRSTSLILAADKVSELDPPRLPRAAERQFSHLVMAETTYGSIRPSDVGVLK